MTRGISKVWGKIAASVFVDYDDVSEFECLRLVIEALQQTSDRGIIITLISPVPVAP